MNHINVLLHFVSFASGIGFIILSYTFYAKYKSQLLKLIITADIFYTILLVIDSLDIYIRKNLIEHYEILHPIADKGQFFIGFALLHYITNIVYQLTAPNSMPKQKYIYLSLLSIPLLLSILLVLINLPWVPPGKYYVYLINSYLCGLLLYNFKILLHHFSKMNAQSKTIIRNCGGSIFIILPLWLLTTIFDCLPLFMYKIPYTPLLYFCLNAIGLIRLKKYFVQGEITKECEEEVTILAEKNGNSTVFITLQTTYHITERENEIINSILEGNSNQVISTQLFISLNTVKNHIYNIYRKLGIKNRYELISLITKLKK